MTNSPMDPRPNAKKDRIDSLAATAGATGTAVKDVRIDTAGSVTDTGGVSLIASAWSRLRRNPVFLFGATITLLFVVLALIAPWIAPHDATKRIPALLDELTPGNIPGPRDGFPLGSDEFGRDLLSRLLEGARQTLIVGVFATIFGLLGGVTLGTLADIAERAEQVGGCRLTRRGRRR